MNELLTGRTAVVTGAAQGIGLAIATTLARHGAHVFLADLDQDRTSKAAASIDLPFGAAATAVTCNVTDADDVARLADLAATTGRLDVWVNNAGVTRDSSLKKMSLADFKLVIDVHLSGTWLGVRAAIEVMREQKSGSVVNLSSLSGKSGNPGQTNYSAAKAGVVGLTKAAAKEVAHHGVRVNAVAPGLIRTAMTLAMPPEVFAQREADVPMRRAGEPGEVADAVLFLASDMSTYITGTVIEVGGGRFI